jgi:BirA family biotin operon repressor/biotin-[acetyl-CoA-carboxylase] ligase
MSTRDHILVTLADGRFHSGQALGAQLGISRSAIFKHVQAIAALGLEVQAVTGKGYRLARPLELLDADQVLASCGDDPAGRPTRLEILHDVDSTNQYLLERAKQGAPSGAAVLAERQRHGRGRRGRAWQSPFGENIYLSLLWQFNGGIAQASGLTLALGIGVVQALRDLGLTDARLKWPNDIVWRDQKIAGVLVELAGDISGPCHAVIGIGLNLYLPPAAAQAIDQPWADVETALGNGVSRNRAAGRLLHHTLQVLARYARGGLAPFLDEWRQLDAVCNRAIELHTEAGSIAGIARGIAADGALIVERDGQREQFAFGEISLRVALPPATPRPATTRTAGRAL